MTEWEKMLTGKLNFGGDPYICEMRLKCRRILYEYNNSHPDDVELRKKLQDQLFGKHVNILALEPFFYCDYGVNIEIGDDCIVNSGCVFLDEAPIKIGRHCMFAPGVKLSAVSHPIDPELRAQNLEYCDPIVIGDNVWIGAGAIVTMGVTIGDNSVIGAGSVVTKNVPANVVALGLPCKVIREISPADRQAMDARF